MQENEARTTSILSRNRSKITFLMGNMHETTSFCNCRSLRRSHRVVGHLAAAESGYQRALGWDATLTVPGRAPQQAAARRTLSSARREARGPDVDLLLHRACEADQGERLRRADRAVEAVGALLQPAEGRVQREPQRTGGRGAWRGRVFAPRASAHRFSVSRLHLWVRGHVCAARDIPRSSDSLSRKL